MEVNQLTTPFLHLLPRISLVWSTDPLSVLSVMPSHTDWTIRPPKGMLLISILYTRTYMRVLWGILITL